MEIVRRGYEFFDATHTPYLDTLAPNVLWDMSHFESWPERRLYEGHEGSGSSYVAGWSRGMPTNTTSKPFST